MGNFSRRLAFVITCLPLSICQSVNFSYFQLLLWNRCRVLTKLIKKQVMRVLSLICSFLPDPPRDETGVGPNWFQTGTFFEDLVLEPLRGMKNYRHLSYLFASLVRFVILLELENFLLELENLNLGNNFWTERDRVSYYVCVFHMARHSCPYQIFWHVDLDIEKLIKNFQQRFYCLKGFHKLSMHAKYEVCFSWGSKGMAKVIVLMPQSRRQDKN